MLQRQEPEENVPLTERRVTTEEFTHAVAALEARKEAERQRLAGTVPIAETVQELGIDAKPDEIWTEVQAQRARQAAAQVAPQPQSHFTATETAAQVTPRRQRRFRWFPILLVVFFATRIFTHHAQVDVSHGFVTSPGSTSMASFAEIPNDYPVYCDNIQVDKLQHGMPLSDVIVNNIRTDDDWTLIKYGGHVYLRGYTLPLSDQAMQAQSVKIYNIPIAPALQGRAAMPVTLRLEPFVWQETGGDSNGEDNWSEITVSQPHLDSHAHEAWSP